MYFSVVSDFCCGEAKESYDLYAAAHEVKWQYQFCQKMSGEVDDNSRSRFYKKGEKTCTKVIPWN